MAAQDLNVNQIINFSNVGQCFDNLLHIILQEELDPDAYYLIGIPPIVRYSYYVDDGTKYNATILDKSFNKKNLEIQSMTGVRAGNFEQRFSNEKEYIGNYSAEWNECLILEKVFLLAQYMLQSNRKFIIFNLNAKFVYQDLWPPGMNVTVKLKQISQILVFDHSLTSVNEDDKIFPVDYKQYGWLGHYDAPGHLNFYQKVLKPKLIELNWIKHD